MAVVSARSFGVAPYRDWAHAAPILEDILANLCAIEMRLRKEGKPYDISSPNDSAERSRRIQAALQEHTIEGSYRFTLTGGFDGDGLDDDDEYRDVQLSDAEKGLADGLNSNAITEVPRLPQGD